MRDLVNTAGVVSSLAGCDGGEKQNIHPELWRACAGPLINLPAAGTHVVYFPQGHSEQVAASMKKDVDAQIPNYPNLPSRLLCLLHNVSLHADPETDEVYAQMTLQPVPNFDKDAILRSDFSLKSCKTQTEFFCKTLTASDTSMHGGFSVPRRAAEKIFPPLDFTMQPPVQELVAKDLHENMWTFRHIYRGQPKRHLLTTGWSLFVSGKRLFAGDSVLFIRDGKQNLLLGIRRANRQPTNLSSSVLSSDSMHIGILAAAAHAAANNSPFTVFYNPRASPAEFVIPLAKFYKAVNNNQISSGMRFRMVFETEDSGTRRYMGTIMGISDVDAVRWRNSQWRNLQVGWDESSSGAKHNRVSVWEIEPVTVPFFICPTPPFFGSKRPRDSAVLHDDSSELDNILKRTAHWLADDLPMKASSNSPGLSLVQWMNLRQNSFLANPIHPNFIHSTSCSLQKFPGDDLSHQALSFPSNKFQAQLLQPQALIQSNTDLQQQQQQQQPWIDSFLHGNFSLPIQKQFKLQPLMADQPRFASEQLAQEIQETPQPQELQQQMIDPSQSLPWSMAQTNVLDLCRLPTLSQVNVSQAKSIMNSNSLCSELLGHVELSPCSIGNQFSTASSLLTATPETGHSGITFDVPPPASPPPTKDGLKELQHESDVKACLKFSKSQNHSSQAYANGPEAQMDYLDTSSSTSPRLSHHDIRLWHGGAYASNLQSTVLPDASRDVESRADLLGGFERRTDIDVQMHMLIRDNLLTKGGMAGLGKDIADGNRSSMDMLADYESPQESSQDLSCSMVSQAFGIPDMEYNLIDSALNDGNFLNTFPWAPHPNPHRMRTYTKVYKRGAVGRSIDITRYSGYDELRQDLSRRFGIEGQLENRQRTGWKLVYVDHENDVLLVGDDPWEEFVNCVRYIKILSPHEVQQLSMDGDCSNSVVIPNPTCSSSGNRNS